MRLSGSLEQRLERSIQPGFYIVRASAPVLVEETAEDGRAHIEIDAGRGSRSSGRSIAKSSASCARPRMRTAPSSCGGDDGRGRGAHRPAASKIMSGEGRGTRTVPEDAEDVEARRRIFDWHEEQVYLKDIEPRVLHKKLPLTPCCRSWRRYVSRSPPSELHAACGTGPNPAEDLDRLQRTGVLRVVEGEYTVAGLYVPGLKMKTALARNRARREDERGRHVEVGELRPTR